LVREAFRQRHCIVPADGFYEWTGPKSKRQQLWIDPHADGLMLFAGLYESWYPEKDRAEVTFTIVTCAANAAIAEIHDRMPVVLDERAAEDWMNPLERDPLSLKRLLVPVANDLLAIRPASPLVNSVKNEGPALLEVRVTRNIFCPVEPMRKVRLAAQAFPYCGRSCGNLLALVGSALRSAGEGVARRHLPGGAFSTLSLAC
jgi:hypothetical protein